MFLVHFLDFFTLLAQRGPDNYGFSMHFSQIAGMPSRCLDGSVFLERLKHTRESNASGSEVFSGAGILNGGFDSKWLGV